jgi:hypothetical protein
MFSAPIPGQSLTSEPRSYAWENPPEYSAPEDALMWHLENLDDPKKTEAMISLMGLGLDITTMTEGILRGAVADGRHTIDVSMIIAPVIHEYIVGVAEAANIEYNEGFEEDELDLDSMKSIINKQQASKILEEVSEGEEIDLPDAPEEMMMEQEQPVEEEKPMGLMSRRGS